MHGAPTFRIRLMGWLLCVAVIVFALFPAQCSACNGVLPFQQTVSAQQASATVRLSPADHCDGACSCCLLQVLPTHILAQTEQERVFEAGTPEPIQHELVRPSVHFRPPRLSIVS